jgi:hypothetical protein
MDNLLEGRVQDGGPHVKLVQYRVGKPCLIADLGHTVLNATEAIVVSVNR